MAVIVERLNVVVRVDAVERIFAGGMTAFQARNFTSSMCSDDELVRFGATNPFEVQTTCTMLERQGFTHLENGKAKDFVVVDQILGPSTPCEWVEFGRAQVHLEGVSVCRLRGSRMEHVTTPESWSFGGSPSDYQRLITEAQVTPSMQVVADEGGFTVYREGETTFFLRNPKAHK